MKRIVICMDGTWQTLIQDQLTNIGIIARSVAHKETRPDGSHVHQTVIYTLGVGSSLSALAQRGWLEDVGSSFNRMAGGALGEGLEDSILDTYLRLAFNYEAGDEIYIFGFSRGAFAARRLAGLINTAGIVSRRYTHKAREGFRLYYEKPRDGASEAEKQEHERAASQFRMLYGKGDREDDGRRRQTDFVPQITYLGVFDTVAQRGFGDVMAAMTPWSDPERFRFKNYRMCPNVRSARHAMAVDENRIGFPPMPWDGLEEANQSAGARMFEQRWFIGTHGDVGGGVDSKLSALALKWVTEGAAAHGLRFYAKHADDVSPLDETLAQSGLSFDAPITRPSLWRAFQPINYPFRTRQVWSRREPPSPDDMALSFDSSVLRRATADHVRPRYRPGWLKPFRKALKEWRPPAD